MDINSVYHPIKELNPGRPILADERLVPASLQSQGDWAGVMVQVPEPWIEAARPKPGEVLPEALARVMVEEHPMTGDGMEPSIHLLIDRNPGLRGAAGCVVMTFADAAEALHLGRLLVKAAEAAKAMAEKPCRWEAKL